MDVDKLSVCLGTKLEVAESIPKKSIGWHDLLIGKIMENDLKLNQYEMYLFKNANE
ncbi:hypothetical protein [Enterococcus italicus]|uniref:hypothetical protein n=1 Tax=Enterococcus italicus TaxID=246144 RepID=UPI003F48F774